MSEWKKNQDGKGKAKNNNTWVLGTPIKIENKYMILTDEYKSMSKAKSLYDNNILLEVYATEVDEETICRNTGLNNGKYKLYESDIIKTEDGQIGIIRYGTYGTHIGFFIEWKSEQAKHYRQELGYWWEVLEVIGNIYDKVCEVI